jgi:hypothetical protein
VCSEGVSSHVSTPRAFHACCALHADGWCILASTSVLTSIVREGIKYTGRGGGEEEEEEEEEEEVVPEPVLVVVETVEEKTPEVEMEVEEPPTEEEDEPYPPHTGTTSSEEPLPPKKQQVSMMQQQVSSRSSSAPPGQRKRVSGDSRQSLLWQSSARQSLAETTLEEMLMATLKQPDLYHVIQVSK